VRKPKVPHDPAPKGDDRPNGLDQPKLAQPPKESRMLIREPMKRRTTARVNEHCFRERSTLAETAKRPKNVRAPIPAILSGQQVRPAAFTIAARRSIGGGREALAPCG
jgi:hypothetical protein